MHDLKHTTSGIARISTGHRSLYRSAGLDRRRCKHEMDRRGGSAGPSAWSAEMSGLPAIADAVRTCREVREVPGGDICNGAHPSEWTGEVIANREAASCREQAGSKRAAAPNW